VADESHKSPYPPKTHRLQDGAQRINPSHNQRGAGSTDVLDDLTRTDDDPPALRKAANAHRRGVGGVDRDRVAQRSDPDAVFA